MKSIGGLKLKKRGEHLFAKKKKEIFTKQKAKRGEAVICKANQLDVVAISLLHQVAAISIIVQTPTQICNTVTEIQKYRSVGKCRNTEKVDMQKYENVVRTGNARNHKHPRTKLDLLSLARS